MSAHAILAPSSAPMWRYCPGSVAMQRRYPEAEDSPKALEGTAAHWFAAELKAGRLIDIGQIAPNGVMLNDEMMDAVELYVDQLPSDAWIIEQRIACKVINAECWGTPDAWRFGDGMIDLVDYKYGHRHVEVFENWQLITYMAGILETLGINGLQDQHIRCNFTIVQPRSYHGDGPIRKWSCMASDLRPYINKLERAAWDAMQTDAPCKPGTYCRDCTASHVCPALQAAGYHVADLSREPTPFELSVEEMGLELHYLHRAQKLLNARIDGLEEAALASLKAGKRVPFYAVKQGHGRERWTRPVPEVVALGQMMGVDVAKPGLITPNQARKAGLPTELVDSYSETPVGEIKLVPDDNSRARMVFSLTTTSGVN
jgi:hypothetical protein